MYYLLFIYYLNNKTKLIIYLLFKNNVNFIRLNNEKIILKIIIKNKLIILCTTIFIIIFVCWPQ